MSIVARDGARQGQLAAELQAGRLDVHVEKGKAAAGWDDRQGWTLISRASDVIGLVGGGPGGCVLDSCGSDGWGSDGWSWGGWGSGGARVGRHAPYSRIELELVPEADQPGLEKLPALGWWELLLLLHVVMVRPVPGRPRLLPGGDERWAGHNQGISDVGRVGVGLQPAGVAEQKPQPAGGRGGRQSRGCCWGGRRRRRRHGVRALEDGESIPRGMNRNPRRVRDLSGTDSVAPLWGKADQDGLQVLGLVQR
jgi:hypothetical protein